MTEENGIVKSEGLSTLEIFLDFGVNTEHLCMPKKLQVKHKLNIRKIVHS